MNLVFFDIDGTLAIGRNVPESAQKALGQLRRNGDMVFICTGRCLPYVKKNFHQYADGYICSNGRYAVTDQGEILYDQPLSAQQVEDLVKSLDQVGCGYVFNGQEHGWYGGMEGGFEVMEKVWDPGYLQNGFPEEYTAYCFDVYFPGMDLHRIQEKLSGTCLLNPHGPHPTADVTILGVDKGSAVRAVAAKLGIPIGNTYAFGDGINDLCMLEASGHGIAMGNAMDELKEKADYITTDIMDDGVMNGLKHYGLI